MSRVYSAAAREWIELGQVLGRGGEGAVHELPARPGFVAKLYHQPVNPDKALKLEGMARQAHSGLLEIAAWPVDVLRHQPTDPILGFVMPRVKGYHEIHSLYGPAHRKRTFPHADWSFLIHAARNLASAFEVVHGRDHVIGDVNPGNVVVSGQALVKLIDCDSFQINTGTRLFSCDVGVPQFTAPELQGRSFHGLNRTTDHDGFGLALLCFHLLFMGRHPFAGRYQGKGDMPIERAIKEYRFAFGKRAASRGMEPPPHTLPFEALPQQIGRLFEQAFTAPASAPHRPTAREWRLALEQLNRELRTCERNATHKYPRLAPDCPWCLLERASGTAFFGLLRSSATKAASTQRSFQLEAVWQRILAITPPGTELPPRPTRQPPVIPTPLSAPLLHTRQLNLAKTVALIATTVLASLARPSLIWLWLLLALAVWPFTQNQMIRREHQRRQLALLNVRQQLADTETAWQQLPACEAFARKRQELQRLRERYQNLSAAFQQDLRRLESSQRQLQLQAFLESHFIDAAQIQGLRATDLMALASYGIETAADITPAALANVPGFGQHFGQQRAAMLLTWRQMVERRFRHDPQQRIDPAAITDLQEHYAQQRAEIEDQLLAGCQELATIKTAIFKQRAQLSTTLTRQTMQQLQAQADLRVFRPPGLTSLAKWRNRI